MIFHGNMEHFALTVAEALEAAAQALKSQSREIRDLHRLVSALDTRLDRLEVPLKIDEPSLDVGEFDNLERAREYDPNTAAESQHGEPR